MNKCREIDPEQVAKAGTRVTFRQYVAAQNAFLLIRDARKLVAGDWAWTVAAAYRAGRLSMWRDMARLRRRKPKTHATAYRWMIHWLAHQLRGECRLKRLHELAQYLLREELGDE